MGTAKGNIGRKMYSSSSWKDSISRSLRYNTIDFEKICEKCKSVFVVKRKINKAGIVIIPKHEKVNCSRKCANSRAQTQEANQKRSLKLNKQIEITCKYCKNVFFGIHNKFCSRKCYYKYKKQQRLKRISEYQKYRDACQFNFSLGNCKSHFDFELVKKYGWYKAKNRGDNLNGVSRDHIISIKYGYTNGISPEIMRHPANCQLLRHNDNVSKGTNSSITLNELVEKIKNWR